MFFLKSNSISYNFKNQIMEEEDFLVYEKPSKKLSKCGCYVLNKKVQHKKDNSNVLAPIVSSDYQVEIVNSIANVTLTQLYVNPTAKFLEMEYNFPINPEICVHRLTAIYGDKLIEGVVKEKNEAKKEYN